MENISLPISFNYDQISQLHIELTNRCNAACPMCVRFHNNSPLIRSDLELGEITLDQFKKWFPPEFLKKIRLILFCGVHGDPCVAKDVLEITEYIIESSPNTVLRFHTNGGMRKPQWWKKFGEILKSNSQNWVTFSIDGLEDTNHIYRRNVVWNKLIENVQEYISSGAYAVWDFLIFKHNEHQIDQAKDLAKTLGFKEFVPKKALGVDDGEYLKPMVALNKEGQLEYIIEAPTNPKNRNLEDPIGTKQYQEFPFTKEEYEKNRETKFLVKLHNKRSAAVYDDIKHKNYTNQDSCQIKCKSFQTQGVEVFIDNFGNVLPCCYVGTRINGRYSDHGTLQLHHEMNKYGFEKFNLNTFSIKEILDAQHLDRVFADSWNKESINSGKLLYCAETCGTYSALDKILTHEDRERFK